MHLRKNSRARQSAAGASHQGVGGGEVPIVGGIGTVVGEDISSALIGEDILGETAAAVALEGLEDAAVAQGRSSALSRVSRIQDLAVYIEFGSVDCTE